MSGSDPTADAKVEPGAQAPAVRPVVDVGQILPPAAPTAGACAPDSTRSEPSPPDRRPWGRWAALGIAAFLLFHLGVAGAAWRRTGQTRAVEAVAARDGVGVRFESFPATTPAAEAYLLVKRGSLLHERIDDAGWATGKVARTLTLERSLSDADARTVLTEAAGWPGLTALETRGPLSDDALTAIEALPHLRRWGAAGAGDLAPILAAAARTPGLRVLMLYSPTLTATDIEAFGDLSHLTTVILLNAEGEPVDRIRPALPRAVVVSAP